ncbi:MAG: hypothetical protein ACRCZ9_09475 [Fusobacteriaceae bacterium]
MFKEFKLEEIQKRFSEKKHQVIYINYNRADGVKIFDNIGELTSEHLNHFNKIYIFNDEIMITASLFDKGDIRYIETLKDEFCNTENYKEFYLEKCSYEKIKVRVGKTKDGRERIQYVELRGGDNA